MSAAAGSSGGAASVVERQFDASPDFWQEVYADSGVSGLVYRGRMATALQWVDDLRLAPGTEVLEVGCGAGLLSLELAGRGLRVTATDASIEMVTRARRNTASLQAVHSPAVIQADVEALPFDAGRFALVVGLGLLPWVPDLPRALAEIVRVTASDGWLLLTADNRSRLNFLLEPRESPLLTPLKLARRGLRRARGLDTGPGSSLHRPRDIDRLLMAAGARPARRATFGFGPFTVLGRKPVPERPAIAAHERLQRAAASSPSLRRTGWHYIVLARVDRGA